MSKRKRHPAPEAAAGAPERRQSHVLLIAGVTLLLFGAAALMTFRARGERFVSTPALKPNVLLITIDTLRWDRLGSYGAKQGATPVLDRLASRGARFETAIAHAPLTAPSHASILTGLTPLRHGVRDNGAFVLPGTIPSIATALRKAGYTTAGFISGFPLDRRFGFASGFDSFDDRLPSGGPGQAAYTERRADDTTMRVTAWLEDRRSASQGTAPFFLWVHYFDPHAAYDPPPQWRQKMASAYDGEIAFVDEQIGRLFDHMAQLGAASNTIVAVTADHGESLGEHGEETHGVFIYDSTLRVPLILSGPGVPAALVSAVLARGIDLMPTLLDVVDVRVPDGLDGRSLRPALEGRSMADEPAYIESMLAERHFGWAALSGLRDARWKYIDAPDPELYDVIADSAEQTNRAADEAARVTMLAGHLGAQVRAANTPSVERPQEREASERLRALGYAGGSSSPSRTGSGRRNPKTGIALINRLEHGIASVRTDPRRAVAELRSVLRDDPGIAIARSQLAVAFSTIGDHDAAIEQLRVLMNDRAASAEDLLLLSESYRSAGHVREADDALRKAATLDPQSPEVALTEARSFMIARNTERAAAAFTRALTLSPDNAEALVGLGEIAMQRGDLSTATSHFERVLAHDSSNPAARLRLGLVRGRQGRMDDAIALLKPVVASTPDNGEALAALAAALARSGRASEAVPYFERAVAAGQRTSAVFNGLGFSRLESGDRAGALDALRRSLAVDPNQPRVEQAVRDIAAQSRLPRSPQ